MNASWIGVMSAQAWEFCLLLHQCFEFGTARGNPREKNDFVVTTSESNSAGKAHNILASLTHTSHPIAEASCIKECTVYALKFSVECGNCGCTKNFQIYQTMQKHVCALLSFIPN